MGKVKVVPWFSEYVEKRKFTIAVVEDNGMARINLRNHLLDMDFDTVESFTQGRELKASMKRRHYDLILMDFHLGENKNGVEVIQDVQKEGLMKHTTCLIFITSDRLPMIIGQIVDIHPDDLVIKPYTIRTLSKIVNGALRVNKQLRPVLKLMDEGENDLALEKLDVIITTNTLPKSKTQLIKLRARLLLKLERFDDATDLYQKVLDSSDKVIWAKWGLIHSKYLAGETDVSEELLKEMLGAHLTNDKACEWLARISIGRKEFGRAEEYMDQIRESSLSMAASKLKSYVLQVQDKMDDAIEFLERKRQASRSVREKFAELSLDLARCYLSVAESKPSNEREKSLQVARFLIGTAGRKNLDESLTLKGSYMNTLAAILEGNIEKANELLGKEGMDNFARADISTMTDAVKAFLGVGDELKASQILFEAEERMAGMEDLTDKTLSTMLVEKSEESIGARRPRALKFNKEGLELHGSQKFEESIDYFYQAYILFPREPAFGLNLLQSLVEAQSPKHKSVKTLRLFNELDSRELSAGNRDRLVEIGRKIDKDKDAFVVAEPPPDDDFGAIR